MLNNKPKIQGSQEDSGIVSSQHPTDTDWPFMHMRKRTKTAAGKSFQMNRCQEMNLKMRCVHAPFFWWFWFLSNSTAFSNYSSSLSTSCSLHLVLNQKYWNLLHSWKPKGSYGHIKTQYSIIFKEFLRAGLTVGNICLILQLNNLCVLRWDSTVGYLNREETVSLEM